MMGYFTLIVLVCMFVKPIEGVATFPYYTRMPSSSVYYIDYDKSLSGNSIIGGGFYEDNDNIGPYPFVMS